GLGWHQRLEATRLELRLELVPDERILAGVLDLVAGQVLEPLATTSHTFGRVEGEVASIVRTQVEVLVEPAVRGNEPTSLVPRDDHLVLPLFPHDGVALAARNDDHDARSVAMPLLVGPGREDRHVAPHRGVGELHAHPEAAGAALLVR